METPRLALSACRHPRRWIKVATGICVCALVVFAVLTWPSMFVSEGRELTGANIGLREIARFGDDGDHAWLYQISESDAQALDADRQSLRKYPMWSALAFDGYNRVRWQTLDELRSGPDQILAQSVFDRSGSSPDIAHVRTHEDAHDLAASLAQRPDVLIAGWYRVRGGVVARYFVYVLDLKQRILIKLSLHT